MTDSGDTASSGRRRRTWLRIAAALAGLACAALAVLWVLRDLPRAAVERALARRLQAVVTLGGLRVFGWDQVELLDVGITRVAGQPLVERVHVARIVALGSLPEFKDAHFRELVLSGLEVDIAPAPPGPFPAPVGPPASAVVARLVIEPARLVFRSPGREQSLTVSGVLTGFGTALAGDLALDSSSLDVAALATLAGVPAPGTLALTFDRLAGTVSIERNASIVRARIDASSVTAASPPLRIAAVAPRAVLTATSSGAGFAVDAEAHLGTLVDSVVAHATLDAAATPLTLSLAVRGASIAPFVAPIAPDLALSGTLDLDLTRGTPTGPLAFDATARVERAALGGIELRDSQGTLTGTLQPPRTIRAHGALVAGAASGRVAGHALPSSLGSSRVEFDAELADLERRAITGHVALATRTFGRLAAEGSAWLLPSPAIDVRWSWSGARLEPLVAYARSEWRGTVPDALAVRGSVAAHGTAAGSLDAPRLDASFALDGLEVAGLPGGVALARAKASGDAALAGTALHLRELAASGTADVPRAGAWPVVARVRSIEVDAARGTAVLNGIELSSPPLAALAGRATWDAAGLAGSFTLAPVQLAAARERLRAIADPLPGFTVKGTLESEFALHLDRRGAWTASGPFSIAAAGLASGDGSRVIEGLGGTLRAEAHGTLGASALAEASVAGPLGGAQVLWESFFGDFSSISAAVTARLRPEGGAWLADAAVELPGPLHVSGAVHAGAGPLRYEGTVAARDLDTLTRVLVKVPFAGASPLIDTLDAKGAFALDVHGTLDEDARTLAGTARGSGIALRVGSVPLDAQEIAFELPFDLRVARGVIGGERRDGPVSFGALSLGGLTLPGMANRVHLEGDDAWLELPVSVAVFGGTVLLERLALRDVLQPQRHADAAVEVRAIDLARVTRTFALPELEGTVDARLPLVAFDGPDVKVDGGGEVRIFGGTVRFGEIRAQNLFSRFPKVFFSAEFHGIDLARVTRRFDVGEMTGIVGGYVRPIELFGGVPVRFDAELRTEPRAGVKRTINVKAINNVTILGTGAGGSAFERGLARFFKRYTYSAIGIHMTLENDAFLLRGLEHRGDRELFVKGRLPLPIDVVNAQPGRAVSFRSMLDRFQAIDFSAATTKPSGP